MNLMAFTDDSDIAFLLIMTALMSIYLCWLWSVRKLDQVYRTAFSRSQIFYCIHSMLGLWPLLCIIPFIVFYKGHSPIWVAFLTVLEGAFYVAAAFYNVQSEVTYRVRAKQNHAPSTIGLLHLAAGSGTAIALGMLRIFQLRGTAFPFFITDIVGFVLYILGSVLCSYVVTFIISMSIMYAIKNRAQKEADENDETLMTK